MRKLLSLTILLVFSQRLFSQSLTYINKVGDSWRSITILLPPKKPDLAKAFYNSDNSSHIEEINEVRDISNSNGNASVVTIGSDKTQYLLIYPKDGKRLVMSDIKGLFVAVYDLDSNIYNPPALAQTDYSDTAKSLVSLFKLLL